MLGCTALVVCPVVGVHAAPPPADEPAPIDAPESGTEPGPADAPPPPADAPPDDAPAPDDGGVEFLDGTFTIEESGLEDDPTGWEPKVVGGIAAGLSALGLATAAGFGTFAYIDYRCLADVAACNQGAATPLRGRDVLALKDRVEYLSVAADAALLVSAAAAAVAAGALVFVLWPGGADDAADDGDLPVLEEDDDLLLVPPEEGLPPLPEAPLGPGPDQPRAPGDEDDAPPAAGATDAAPPTDEGDGR